VKRHGTSKRMRKVLSLFGGVEIDRTKHNKSRITNGRKFLPQVDGRSVLARRFRDIASALITDQGGPELLSEARNQIIRRMAAAATVSEQLEADTARGNPLDLNAHALLTNAICKCADRIGIDRRSKTVGPMLSDILDKANQRLKVSPLEDAIDV
jgi:hypothetical protein